MSRRKKKQILFVDYYDEWVVTYKEGLVADVTLQKYLKNGEVLRNFIPDLSLSDLDRREYQKIINEYAKTREKQTVTDFHHQIKSCLKDAFYDGLIEKDPTYKAVMKGIAPREREAVKFLQTDELKKLIRSLELTQGINKDWVILIAAKTGLRYGELLALTPKDFDFVNNTLTVDKTWNYKSTAGGFMKTKTSSSIREIGIDWQIVGQFRPMLEGLPEDEPIFVEKYDNGRYKREFNSTMNNRLKRLCTNAEIPIITMHSLRHTHASVLLAAGVSIHSISGRLGHSDVSITQETYAHVLDELQEKDNQIIISTLMQIA